MGTEIEGSAHTFFVRDVGHNRTAQSELRPSSFLRSASAVLTYLVKKMYIALAKTAGFCFRVGSFYGGCHVDFAITFFSFRASWLPALSSRPTSVKLRKIRPSTPNERKMDGLIIKQLTIYLYCNEIKPAEESIK